MWDYIGSILLHLNYVRGHVSKTKAIIKGSVKNTFLKKWLSISYVLLFEVTYNTLLFLLVGAICHHHTENGLGAFSAQSFTIRVSIRKWMILLLLPWENALKMKQMTQIFLTKRNILCLIFKEFHWITEQDLKMLLLMLMFLFPSVMLIIDIVLYS